MPKVKGSIADRSGGVSRPEPGDDAKSTGKSTETDPVRIKARQKQVDYGKNTVGYDNYINAVPKKMRCRDSREHPRTPDVYQAMSKRRFDGLLRVWRRELHKWDTVGEDGRPVVRPTARRALTGGDTAPDVDPSNGEEAAQRVGGGAEDAAAIDEKELEEVLAAGEELAARGGAENVSGKAWQDALKLMEELAEDGDLW